MRAKQTYQWLLLDADNTLFDFDAAERHALRHAVADCALPCDQAVYDFYHRCNDQLWKRLEEGTVTRAALKILRFSQTVDWMQQQGYPLPQEPVDYQKLCQRYIEHLGECSLLFEGAKELCQSLSACYRLAMITNGTAIVQHRRIEGAGLLSYFEGIFISEEMGAEKPSPAFFDQVCESLQITDRKQALVIGDSMTSDMKGAFQAGIDSCFFSSTPPSHPEWVSYQVSDFAALKNLLLTP
jgi:2-haloacid dehalogenase